MILRWVAREFRDFPATSALCLAWIVVFVAMTGYALAEGNPPEWLRWLAIGFGGGTSFGDLSLTDLTRGQIWRIMTCNFIHYSVVHLGLNLIALYQIGSLLESWYGPYQMVFVYGLTGGVGNLLSAMARLWMGSDPKVHSAGGSVAIMGMVGVCAVAAWRSALPEGRRLGRLMLIFIGLTAALGAAFPHHIDNWGHAGGLVVGLGVGLWHRSLRARVGKPAAWGVGMLTLLIVVVSAGAQFVTERREGPQRLERRLVMRTSFEVKAARVLGRLRMPGAPPAQLLDASQWLEALERTLSGTSRVEAQALRALVAEAARRPLTEEEQGKFREHIGRLLESLGRDFQEDRRRLKELRAR